MTWVLQAAGGESFDQLSLPGGAALDGIYIGQVPRAGVKQDDADHGGDEARPEIVLLEIAQRAIHRRLRDAGGHGGNSYAGWWSSGVLE